MNEFKKNKRTIFFAYPWDVFVMEAYDDITKPLTKSWDIKRGSIVTKSNLTSSKVEMFRNRNKQLYDIFVSGIASSDVFIADITNANANVMLELGIAIQLNKNILIVTSQDAVQLPFDVKHFQVNKYKNKEELKKIINDHLSIFLKITSQDFGSTIEGDYFKSPEKQTISNELKQIKLPWRLKNLKLRLEYKFISVTNDIDWLGIHLRASSPYITASELVYVRKNENLEVVTIPFRPNPTIGKDKKIIQNELDDGFTRLELFLEGNRLQACTSHKFLEDRSIMLESFGNVYLQGNAHNPSNLKALSIEYRNIEIIRLDTTTPIN